MSTDAIEVRAVASAADWAAFHALRPALYRDDPAFVRPLASEARLAIDAARHPFWQHAERQAFLARRNGRVVGRIAAIADRLHNQHYGDRTGFFGFFECEDDPAAARALLDAAAGWLEARGLDADPRAAEPVAQGRVRRGGGRQRRPAGDHDGPHAGALRPAAGSRLALAKVARFPRLRPRQGRGDEPERELDDAPPAEGAHPRPPSRPSHRAGERAQNLAATLKDINEFGNRIRETVWGFTPITPAELDFLTHRIIRVMMPELVLTMRRERRSRRLRHGRAGREPGAGPHPRPGPIILRLAQMPFRMRTIRRARLFGIGADPRLRELGILPALFQAMIEGTLHRFDEFEFGWISEANLQSLRAVQHILPMQPRKTYRLYEARLPLA